MTDETSAQPPAPEPTPQPAPTDVTTVPVPAPVLSVRTTETRGLWLDCPGDETGGAVNEQFYDQVNGETSSETSSVSRDRVWISEYVLRNLDDAFAHELWTQTDALSQDDALIAAGFAVRDRDTEFLRGTAALHALLNPDLDERGGQHYDPAVHGPWYYGDPGTDAMATQAEDEGFQRCVSCGTLPVKYSRLRYHDNALSIDYENALVLTLTGGYAMFVDRAPVQVVFCHDCAHDLCDRYPGIAAELDPPRSHSHTDRYKHTHPDHVGWDTGHDLPDEPDPAHLTDAQRRNRNPRLHRRG